MHWEKIPLESQILHADGRYEKIGLVKEQLEELERQGIPIRFVRTRELDGLGNLYIEKQILD